MELRLENRERAEHLLQEFDKLDALKEADLIRQYKSKGFAHSTELSKAHWVRLVAVRKSLKAVCVPHTFAKSSQKDDLLSALKENMLFG